MHIQNFVLLNLLCLPLMYLSAQISDSASANHFVLTIQTYNHAEKLGNGTMSLKLTEGYLELTNIPSLHREKKRVVFSKKLSKYENSIIQLSQLNVDTLKGFYYNRCVMGTSGYECYFKYKNKKVTKEIRMHHYYLKQIDEIIRLVNLNLPSAYQLDYLPVDTEQNCE